MTRNTPASGSSVPAAVVSVPFESAPRGRSSRWAILGPMAAVGVVVTLFLPGAWTPISVRAWEPPRVQLPLNVSRPALVADRAEEIQGLGMSDDIRRGALLQYATSIDRAIELARDNGYFVPDDRRVAALADALTLGAQPEALSRALERTPVVQWAAFSDELSLALRAGYRPSDALDLAAQAVGGRKRAGLPGVRTGPRAVAPDGELGNPTAPTRIQRPAAVRY